MTQAEVDEYQARVEEVRRVSALWIEAMQAAVAESSKVKEYAAEIKAPPANEVWQRARDEVVAMLNDLSVAERQAAYRQRQAEQAASEVRGIFANKDDHAAIKNYAARLVKKRTKAANAALRGGEAVPLESTVMQED